MLLRTFFANSKFDPTFFTTDGAIEGMAGVLGFNGDTEATAAEFSKEGISFLVRNYLANQPYGEGIELKPSPFDNTYVEIVGMDNPHGFYLFTGEKMEELYDWISGEPDEDSNEEVPPPEGTELVLEEIRRHINETNQTFLIEPVIGTIGLSDGSVNETALVVVFPSLHASQLNAMNAVEESDVIFQEMEDETKQELAEYMEAEQASAKEVVEE